MFVIIVVGQCFSVPESNAQVVFSGGGTFYIDYEINDNVLVRSDYGLTTVNVVAGGRITEYMRAIENGRINVLDGEVVGVLYATSGPVTVSGGILKSRLYNRNYVEVSGGIVQGVLESYSHYTAIVSGGELRNGVLAYNESYASISGGQILKVRAYDDSQVVIEGGVFTDSWDEIIATHNGVITISGTGFNYDYGEIPVSSGTLTGTLDSGEQINNNFKIVHYGEGYDGAAIVLVPTKGTLSIDTLPVKGEVFVNDTSWGIAPQSQEVEIGEYTVSFGGIEGYITPNNQQAVVQKDTTTYITGTYILYGDFVLDGNVIFKDFAVLALAWQSRWGDDNWNQACDISDPNDDVIDYSDLSVFTGNWLTGW